jgi:hypothetical protein
MTLLPLMESLFSSTPRAGSDALLLQLTSEQASPLEALTRIAAFHAGWPSGVRPFRAGFVQVQGQSFPAPQHLAPLVGLLLARGDALFRESRSVRQDLYVAAFLLWGLTAIHPFDDGNGRTALDWAQQVLMRRLGATEALVSSKARLDRRLQPVLRALDVPNDGTPYGFVSQLAGLAARFGAVTLAELEADPHFTAVAQVLAAAARGASPCPS